MITKEFLHDKVVRHIALKILAGELSTLPNEANLGKELKVSRSILRQSVKVLEAKGLVDASPTGTRVRPRTDWHLLDPQLLEWQSESGIDEHFFDNLCELRNFIEPGAAALAAVRATQQDIAELQSAFEKMRVGPANQEAFIAADLLFHDAIIKAAHNELLYQVGATIRVILRMSFSLTNLTTYQKLHDPLPSHKKILDAIVNGRQNAARRHMGNLIVDSTGRLRKALNYGGNQQVTIRGLALRARSSFVGSARIRKPPSGSRRPA